MHTLIIILSALLIAGLLAYHHAALPVFAIAFVLGLLALTEFSQLSYTALLINWSLFFIVTSILIVKPIRQFLITKPILKIYRKLMPSMSQTEKEALEAGTIGFEADLFSGKPDWDTLLSLPKATLSKEEQAFLDGPVEELCYMTNDWDITHHRLDMPPEVWDFIKKKGFFGMIIPKQYGGLEFSAYAQARVLYKLYGVSATVATSVGVPNSLGPAELLLNYGTDHQKNYYLPRLAKGDDIPCFALTNPEAGSDAASIPDYGIVCHGQHEGKDILGIRLNWNKRYITLAPCATILGLAFKLYDPDGLLGHVEELGITCALIPTKTPGVQIGRRHFPLNIAFLNGPTIGEDVFIPVEWVIGGPKMVGQGWRMLMECLAAGRTISLPSSAVGTAKGLAYATGAYARIRKQFNLPIGFFEGIEEPLARIAGYTYMMSAAHRMTLATIDKGEKPSVLSAILKYHLTERGRVVMQDAMDIHGGKAICLGPNNYMGRGYQGIPIGITVEGANILTRSLIIFGQGAIRCHPYVLAELEAAQDSNIKRRLQHFDKALFEHMGYIISSKVRAFVLAMTGARYTAAPKGPTKRYYQQLTRFSAALAFYADVAMLVLGGNLKRKEKISARLGDVLSCLYICSATLKCFEDDGRPEADLPLVHWACRDLLYSIQCRLDELARNFPNKLFAWSMRQVVFPFGKRLAEPDDKLGQQVAKILLTPSATRDRLTLGVYTTPNNNNPPGKMNAALNMIINAEAIEKGVMKAVKSGKVKGKTWDEQIKAAHLANIITEAQLGQLQEVYAIRQEIIAVDDFAPDEL